MPGIKGRAGIKGKSARHNSSLVIVHETYTMETDGRREYNQTSVVSLKLLQSRCHMHGPMDNAL